MNIGKNEQEFVFRYFQSGKLNTQEALDKVKTRTGLGVGRAKTRLRWMAVAASIAVLLVAGAYALLRPKMVELHAAEQVAVCHLPDGTQVTLAPFSSISYREDNCRKVKMKGCAFYQVRHDEQHPFDVEGERGHVRVLGTQFMVDERTDASEVMVTSGKVLFAARKSVQGVFLTKGERARLHMNAEKPEKITEYDVNDVAWATHRLHFVDASLSEVLKRISELSGVAYTVSDERKRLTGDFETDSLPQVIRVIEETLGVTIRQK